jgi:predicted nucleic acid-binding protein
MEHSSKVLDSWTMIAFFEDEPAADAVETLINKSIQAKTQLLMTTVNLGEVWYNIARAKGDEAANRAIKNIKSLDIHIIPADWELSLQAAMFKSNTPVAFADCFAAALAYLRGVELITGDHDFERFEDQISILWVG